MQSAAVRRGKRALKREQQSRKETQERLKANRNRQEAQLAAAAAETAIIIPVSSAQVMANSARRRRVREKRERGAEGSVVTSPTIPVKNVVSGFGQSGLTMNQMKLITSPTGQIEGVLSPNSMSYFPLKPANNRVPRTYANVVKSSISSAMRSVITSPGRMMREREERAAKRRKVNSARERTQRIKSEAVNEDFMRQVGASYRTYNKFTNLADQATTPAIKRTYRKKAQKAAEEVPEIVKRFVLNRAEQRITGKRKNRF